MQVSFPEMTAFDLVRYFKPSRYLLEIVEANAEVIAFLKEWIKKKKPRPVPLRSNQPDQKEQRNNEI